MITAIGAGIGVLGFVMFFGGFILWTRFEAAGLPANEAVARVPRSDLVATGASFIVPAILAALAAAALAVTGWDLAIGSRWRNRRKRAESERLRATEILAGLEEEKVQLEQQIEGYRTRSAQQKQLGDEAGDGSVERESARQAQKAAAEEAEKCEGRLRTLTADDIPAQRTIQKKAAEIVEAKPGKRERILQVAIGAIPMLIAGGLVIAMGWGGLSCGYRALLIGVLALTIAVAIAVVSMTEHFAWYTVCVFLSVGITIAFSTYARTHSHPKVSPVAALSGPRPVVGFLVAETSDALYVGKPQPAGTPEQADAWGFESDRATMLRLPKDTLTGLTIGPITDEDKAYRRSLRLAMALCRRSVATAEETEGTPAAPKAKKGAAASSGPGKPVACSANERQLLVNRLAKAP